MTVLKGIFPSVDRIVRQHEQIYRSGNVATPDQHCKSDLITPYDNKYYCGLCLQELSNSYFHCVGCETILGRDFNLCGICYGENLHLNCSSQLHPHKKNMWSNINHIAKENSHCKCRRDSKQNICVQCSKCPACTCECHKTFTLHHRFMTLENELQLVERIKSTIN